jgi:hypothetical protein
MGHSCGISDRTLLNTIFEHDNCKSIKIYYYYKRENGIDDYSDKVRNISRILTTNSSIIKIINKTECEPLL